MSALNNNFDPEFQSSIDEQFAATTSLFTVTIAYSDGDVLSDHLDKDGVMELVKSALTFNTVSTAVRERHLDVAVPQILWLTITPDAPDRLPEGERL